ncbi:MAG: thioredoxin-dependent thiol peroxidase [bacterium]
MLDNGKSAPLFCLKDSEQNKVCLKDFRGAWVVVYFYPRDNTRGCTLEAQDFTLNLKKFKKLNCPVIGISPDSVSSHQKFVEKYKLKLILLSDPEHQVLEKYQVWQKKKMYGREYWGVVRSTFLINPQGKISHVWTKVKVPGHVDEVLHTLSEKIS